MVWSKYRLSAFNLRGVTIVRYLHLGITANIPRLLLVCGRFCLHFCFHKLLKVMLYWVEISWLTWLSNNISCLCHQKVLSCLHSMLKVIIHLDCEVPAFQCSSIWLLHTPLYPSFFWFHVSRVYSRTWKAFKIVEFDIPVLECYHWFVPCCKLWSVGCRFFDNNIPLFFRVFMTYFNVVKWVFFVFTQERTIQTDHPHLLSSRLFDVVLGFFFKMFVFPPCSLMTALFTYIEIFVLRLILVAQIRQLLNIVVFFVVFFVFM